MHEEKEMAAYQRSFLFQADRERLVMLSLSGKVLELADQNSNAVQV